MGRRPICLASRLLPRTPRKAIFSHREKAFQRPFFHIVRVPPYDSKKHAIIFTLQLGFEASTRPLCQSQLIITSTITARNRSLRLLLSLLRKALLCFAKRYSIASQCFGIGNGFGKANKASLCFVSHCITSLREALSCLDD